MKNSLAMLVSDREISLTQGRILTLCRNLAKAGWKIEVFTTGGEGMRYLNTMRPYPGFHVTIMGHQDHIWTIQERDQFIYEFIQTMDGLKMPGTEFPAWEACAFDDYLWNISTHLYKWPDLSGYDALIVPVQSKEQPPGGETDVILSGLLYAAKSLGLPVVGYAVEPIKMRSKIWDYLINYWISRESTGQKDNTWIINSLQDNYLTSTIQDSRLHPFLDTLPVAKDQMGLCFINHPKGRLEQARILRALKDLPFKCMVSIVTVNYAVKDLHEMNILQSMIIPIIEKEQIQFYYTDLEKSYLALAPCDLIIGMEGSPLMNLWVRQYEKPFLITSSSQTIDEIKAQITSYYQHKQNTLTWDKALREIVGGMIR